MSSILDLKNPKNRKVNNNHSVNDVLDGEQELEPVPIEPAKKSDKHLDNFLNNSNEPVSVDTPDEIQDNPGIMQGPTAPFSATLAHAPLEAARAHSESLSLMGSLSWSAPDKHHELISHAWRKIVTILLVGMAFLALFWQDSLLTAATFFGLALVTSMHFWREARHEQHEIHPHGVVAAGKFYHYHDFDSFWVHFHPRGFHELSLKTGRFLNHYLKIPLGEQDPFEVRDALMNYLPEEKHEEGLDDWLRRKLGL